MQYYCLLVGRFNVIQIEGPRSITEKSLEYVVVMLMHIIQLGAICSRCSGIMVEYSMFLYSISVQ